MHAVVYIEIDYFEMTMGCYYDVRCCKNHLKYSVKLMQKHRKYGKKLFVVFGLVKMCHSDDLIDGKILFRLSRKCAPENNVKFGLNKQILFDGKEYAVKNSCRLLPEPINGLPEPFISSGSNRHQFLAVKRIRLFTPNFKLIFFVRIFD